MATILISNLQHILDLLKEHMSQSVGLIGTVPVILGKFQGEDIALVDFPFRDGEVDQSLGQVADTAEIARVVFLGAGEACNEHLRSGDLVVGGEILAGNEGAGQTAHADHRLVDLCLKAVERNQEEWAIRALVGTICSEPFIPDASQTGIYCSNIVAAATGEACARRNIPFVPLCIIRPDAGDDAAQEVFRRESGARAFWVFKGLLEEIKLAATPTTRAVTTDNPQE